jgi:hypothetical protein
MGSVVSDGLYIVFQWIQQRRREIEYLLPRYNENMFKSLRMVIRRVRMNAGLDPTTSLGHLRRMLYGVRGTTTRTGQKWVERPNHARVNDYYNHWIQTVTAYRHRIENPDGVGSPIITYTPYYLPGL